ncbi:MAG: hypothetical protein Q4A21_02550 [bacterium]|nr:hypothetical protein [bacterium]
MVFNPFEKPTPITMGDFLYSPSKGHLPLAIMRYDVPEMMKSKTATLIFSNIEYAFFEIARDIPDKASLEVVKSAFESMLSKERIEEIVNFVESLRK